MPARKIELTKKEELKMVVSREKYVVVKVTATWCGPCKRSKPLVDKWLESLPESVLDVEVDADKLLTGRAKSLYPVVYKRVTVVGAEAGGEVLASN